MLPDFQMFIHGSANEKTMAVSLHPVGPSGAGEDQTFIVLESVADPTITRSNGRIKSVLDLANTTVLITDTDYVLPSESVLNELFLDSLYMKLRNGHEVHIDLSHVERFTAQGRPVYRYVFPATQD